MAAPAAHAAGLPDLASLSVTSPSGGLSILGGDKVVVKIKNTGKASARKPVVTLLLSSDKLKSSSDPFVGAGSFKAMPGGRVLSATVYAVVSPTVPAGSYYLLACVSTAGQKQSSTKNDCVATKAKLTVRAAAPIVQPQVMTVDALATSAEIGAAGGVVTTQGVDGSTITVTIPKNVLTSSVEIRLVPATVTPGPAGVTPFGAAIIEPEGLAVPGATIEFKLPAALPIPRRLLSGIVFGGEDEAIVRAPFLAGAALRLDAGILGGYGIGAHTGAPPLRTTAGVSECLQSLLAATDPCQAESLRKRLDEIMSKINFTNPSGNLDPGEVQAAADEYSSFERGTLLPAIEAAVNAGAQADELDGYFSIMFSAERFFQLLGVESVGNSAIQKLASIVERVANNTIAACASGKQGPALTLVRVNSLKRVGALLGADLPASVDQALESQCLVKPYYVTYTITGNARGNSNFAPWLSGGTSKAPDIRVPMPAPGPGGSGSASLIFSNLNCDPGGNDSCNFTSQSGGMTGEITSMIFKEKEKQRCGRTVKVPELQLIVQLKVEPRDSLGTHFCRGGDCVDAPLQGSFESMLKVATDGGKVTVPEAGGSTPISGSGNPYGLKVSGSGNVKLSLLPGG
jgi:hypothetical protein